MRLRLDQRVWPAMVGIVVLLVLLAAWTSSPLGLRESLRERALDQLLPLASPPRPAEPAVMVIDIDRATLERVGPWPWPRTRLARLLAAVAAAKPAVIGLDVLLADPDRLSPAVLAREIAGMTGREDIAALAKSLEDGDAAIAGSIADTAAVLGFVLETKGSVSRPTPSQSSCAARSSCRGCGWRRVRSAPPRRSPRKPAASASSRSTLMSMAASGDSRSSSTRARRHDQASRSRSSGLPSRRAPSSLRLILPGSELAN